MKEQLKFVQILRGFAVIAVVFFHLDAATISYFNYSFFHLKYGDLGIEFFFALTGFIITYVHLKDVVHKSSVKKFLMKRAVRVYPFYWLVLLITIGLESPDFPNKPSLRTAINPTTSEGLVNVIKNIFLFPLPESDRAVGIAWGLTYAILYYIVFAICIKAGWRIAKYIFISWLCIVLIYSLNFFPGTLLTDLLAGSRIIIFLTGSAAGYLFVKNKWRINSVQFVFSILAIAVLFAGYVLWKGLNTDNIIVSFLIGVASSLILFYAASLDRDKVFKSFPSPFIVLIGDSAYSIFLTHILFIPYICMGLNKILNVSVIPVFLQSILVIVVMLLTVAAGIITYLIIERPMLNFFRRRFRLKQKRKSWI